MHHYDVTTLILLLLYANTVYSNITIAIYIKLQYGHVLKYLFYLCM